VVAQQSKYLLLGQVLTHPLLALNPLGLRLLAVAVAVAVSMLQVRRLVVVAVERHYGFTLVDLLPQQVIPMPLAVVVQVV
jgi:hypothetical protein